MVVPTCNPALGQLRQQDCQFKTSLPSLDVCLCTHIHMYGYVCLKKTKSNKTKKYEELQEKLDMSTQL